MVALPIVSKPSANIASTTLWPLQASLGLAREHGSTDRGVEQMIIADVARLFLNLEAHRVGERLLSVEHLDEALRSGRVRLADPRTHLTGALEKPLVVLDDRFVRRAILGEGDPHLRLYPLRLRGAVRFGEHQIGIRSGDAALVAVQDGERAEKAEAVRPDMRGAERLRLERVRDDAEHAERRPPLASFRAHRRARPLDLATARFEVGPGFERRADRTLLRRRS